MNLIDDAWIPVRRKNGKIDRIAPWQMTEGIGEDIITELAAPRPDFNGALIQFLIGLVQTLYASMNPQQWRQHLDMPPKSEELHKVFETIAKSFELDGKGPRFMQDLKLEAKDEDKKPISGLLIESPGEKTIADNTDHFIKHGLVKGICPSCAATALFTLQINAPSGGQGHRTGLRGGGPLTTLVIDDTLWKTCWLNTLERQVFLSLCGNQNKDKDQDRFPWLTATRTSENNKSTTPKDTHPEQIYWSMPRRIRLIKSQESHEVTCDLCGIVSRETYRYYVTKNLGINYKGPWMHPLTPYFIADDGTPSAIHPQPGGIGYRHWLGLVQVTEINKGKMKPARIVEHFIRERRKDLRLWAFGYDMDNMKARCWYDCVMPLILTEDKILESYEYSIASLINSAHLVSKEIRAQIRKALFKPNNEVNGDLSFIESRFWQETETAFFNSLRQLREALTESRDVVPILEEWHNRLIKEAEIIFNDVSQTGAFDAANPKRIALAWRDLQSTLHGKKLREELGLSTKTQTV
jgi:CRISPR system Cascade subunit CasA